MASGPSRAPSRARTPRQDRLRQSACRTSSATTSGAGSSRLRAEPFGPQSIQGSSRASRTSGGGTGLMGRYLYRPIDGKASPFVESRA